MKKGAYYIGTSGWKYKHWKGTFYPEGLKDKEEFDYYSRCFRTVEINNSFYRLPAAATFTAWRRKSPAGFTYAVKASRFITHLKKLKADKESLDLFLSRAGHLEEKEGPVLFQLPPGWQKNAERLEAFLAGLPEGPRYVFEFRNETGYSPDIYELLRNANAAFCIYELGGHQSPMEVTADFIYIRLHGPGNKYQGRYTSSQLQAWARRCRRWMAEGRDVYVYFDNDQAGYAAFNAAELQDMLAGAKRK